MPTFTTVALDSLIEPKPSKLASAGKIKTKPKPENRNGNFTITRNGSDGKAESGNSPISIERKHHWTQISPALYATPEPTPLPESDSQLSSFPSSPYVVDHKRRGPRLSKTYSAVLHRESDEKNVEIGKSLEAEDIGSSKAFDTTTDSVKAEDNRVKFHDNVESKKVFDIKDSVSSDLDNIHVKILHNEHDQDHLRKHDTLEHGEMDDFFDPHDTMSLRSSSDGDTNHVVEKTLHSHTPFAEFYDAWEELANETGIQHTATDVEGELREMRSGFLYEVEKRRQAESRLNDMKSQWGRIREQLAIVGLNLPADPTILEDEPANDPGEEICRQVELLRFVSNSVGRGIARAELEVEMESQLQSKNFEIARLLDRVHYYETVNHEMSQRNQESVETMRRLRQKRKKRQRWIWGSIGVAITLGTTALAYSYRSTGKGSSSSSKTNK